jgi:hypothetical protein
VEKEGLPAPVLTDDEAYRGTAVSDALDVAHECAHFVGAPDLDVLLPAPGHHACRKGLKNRVPVPGPDPHLIRHAAISSSV